MIALLHVVDEEFDPAQAPALRTLLTRLPIDRFAQRVAVLGRSPACISELADPRGSARADPLAVRTMRPGWPAIDWLTDRTLRPHGSWLRTTAGAEADHGAALLHAWGLRALAACRRHPERPALAGLHDVPDSRSFHRRLTALDGARVSYVVGNQVCRARLLARGVASQRTAVVRGPVDFRAINDARRADPRRRLAEVGEGPLVVIALPATGNDSALHAAWACGIVQQIHRNLRVILPFASRAVMCARRFLHASQLDEMTIDAPPEWGWPQLVSVADVLLDGSADHAPSEPVAWAMAAGVPVVATAIRSTTELIADRHTGVLSRDDSPYRLASAMLRVLDDAALRRKVSDTARGEAYEVFSQRDYLDNMIRLYENIASDRPVGDGVRDTAMYA